MDSPGPGWGSFRLRWARPGEWYAPSGVSAFFRSGDGLVRPDPRPRCTRGRERQAGSFTAAGRPGPSKRGRCGPEPPCPSPGGKTASCAGLNWSGAGRGGWRGSCCSTWSRCCAPCGTTRPTRPFPACFWSAPSPERGHCSAAGPEGRRRAKRWPSCGRGREPPPAWTARLPWAGAACVRCPAVPSGPLEPGTGTDPCLLVRIPVNAGPR